jgi:superfamily II DNA or RNA helicase
MQSHIPGELLAVRGAIWRLRSQTRHADCTELELEPLDPDRCPCGTADLPFESADPGRVLLEPFDRPEALARDPAPTVVSRRAWMIALLAALSSERRCDLLSAPVAAGIDIYPYQLEPALAMTIRGVPRVLLADAVGLGKTIQAALVIAELVARHSLQRALVLTPSGLRDQWAGELRDRFGLDPIVADAAWLRAVCADLPASVNPWSVDKLIVASIDFVKRPDVLPGLACLTWSIIVIDEAHAASLDSLRRAAAHALSRRARRVLLLTATPHSGDQATFDALCRIGATAVDEPIVLFRRSRTDVGFKTSRRVHLLPVRQTEAERELHGRLLAYVRRIWRERRGEDGADARLATMVLLKRAFSSMGSLAGSLAFRLAHLADPVSALVAQLDLPLDEDVSSADDTPAVLLASPGFEDEREERSVLASLAELARAAAATDSKARVLGRVLRRVSEPCIVFTEFRDTIAAIERALPAGVSRAILHGGMDRRSRAEAVSRFVSGGARVLLATDAGGEGLNLQAGCRLVINLELPWSPIRLEQRIGRVDRIGQRRTVHAINLVAAGTHEASLLARLVHRIECIRDTLGPVEDVRGPGGDMTIAGVLADDPGAVVPWSSSPPPTPEARSSPIERVSFDREVLHQCARLAERRAIRVSLARQTRPVSRARGIGALRRPSPMVAAIPARRLRGRFARPGAVAVYHATTVDEAGGLVDDALLPLFTPFMLPHLSRRTEVVAMAREWLSMFRPASDALALRAATERLETTREMHAQEEAAGLSRSRAQGLISIGEGLMVQGGLFDRRTEREAEQRQREAEQQEWPATTAALPGGTPGDVRLAEHPVLQLLLMVTP